MSKNKKPVNILYVPDTQIREGVPLEHLTWLLKYICQHQPQIIVFAGDWWDMQSLCRYTKGTLSWQGMAINLDLQAGYRAMEALMNGLEEFRTVCAMKHERGSKYYPKMYFTMGNHENRLIEFVERNPEMAGVFDWWSFGLQDFDIEYCKFKGHIELYGIMFSHYVTPTNSTAPINRAHLIMNRYHRSVVVGHTPGLDYKISDMDAGGRQVQCLVAGSFYLHDEDYRRQVCNGHWRGIVHLKNVHNGMYDPEFVSIDTLRKLYG